MADPQFDIHDRVTHHRAGTLGVGVVLAALDRSDDFEAGKVSIGGWWYDVRFDQSAYDRTIEERFAERVLRLSVLDTLAEL